MVETGLRLRCFNGSAIDERLSLMVPAMAAAFDENRAAEAAVGGIN
jgi:hypothetical protein